MVGWYHQLKSEQTSGDSEGQGSLACCIPWGRKESDMTKQLNNNNKIIYVICLVQSCDNCKYLYVLIPCHLLS